MIRKILHNIKRAIKINWIKSAYINLNLLPIKEAVKFPIIVTGKIKIRSLKGRVKIKCKVRFGLINIGHDVDYMPISLLPTQLLINGTLIIAGDIILNQGANLVVWPDATMSLGDDVMICGGVTLKASNKITIGNHVMISSGCFIMDSSMHCIYNTDDLSVSSPFGEITIGNNVWLNMYTDVIKNGQIPNGCITTRYALINKSTDICKENCLIAGQPAKVIKERITQLHNFKSERYVTGWYKNHSFQDVIVLSSSEIKDENLCHLITKWN